MKTIGTCATSMRKQHAQRACAMHKYMHNKHCVRKHHAQCIKTCTTSMRAQQHALCVKTCATSMRGQQAQQHTEDAPQQAACATSTAQQQAQQRACGGNKHRTATSTPTSMRGSKYAANKKTTIYSPSMHVKGCGCEQHSQHAARSCKGVT